MSVVVVGLNHNSAPVDLLERLAIPEERLPKALHQLLTFEHVLEGAVLSTCNRIEVYALVSKFHGGAQDLRNFLSEFCHVAPEDFSDRLYTYHDDAALRHLFRVAAGIDSMVVGESEILGQVRRAYVSAQEEGALQRVLGTAFRKALRAGKRARSETAIGRNPVSISSAAVELSRRAFEGDSLRGRKVAIVGAGKMGRLAAQSLRAAGVDDVTVVNRSEERGQDLAETFGATRAPLEDLPDVLARADILITSTTAPETIIDRAMATDAVAARGERTLFIVDIAVPRDVEAGVRDVPGIVLRDIDDLRGVVEANIGSRMSEVSKVEEIIGEETASFLDWQRQSEVGPTVTELLRRAEEIRVAELTRIAHDASLSDEERDAMDRLTKRIVAKLMHPALEKAKELASSKQGHTYLTVLRELFELDDEGP